MDKAVLVENDLEVEALVIEALSRARIPVTAVEWNQVEETGQWQLVIVTSLYDTKGPREGYTRIFKALKSAGVYKSVPILELYLKSPKDPVAQELLQRLKFTTRGTIHIVRITNGSGTSKYSVVFAPYLGKGGAIPSVILRNEADLRSFLEKRLGILDYAVTRALPELNQRGRTSIFDVELDLKQAKKLNLAA